MENEFKPMDQAPPVPGQNPPPQPCAEEQPLNPQPEPEDEEESA